MSVLSPSIAVVIPCLNETLTIAKVVADFKRELPMACVYVFDNASIDDSVLLAEKAGAIVIPVCRRGKGCVVQAIFETIDADVVVMVDGDDTYSAHAVHRLIEPVLKQGIDMVIGTRFTTFNAHKEGGSFRPLHLSGNRFIVSLINVLFTVKLTDVLSGYRAFSRRFMVSTPVLSHGFEIETELTVHAVTNDYAIVEVPIDYGVRPKGSYSKLSTWRDGFRIIRLIPVLFKNAFPLRFFFILGLLFFCLAAWWGYWVFKEFETYQRIIGIARAIAVVGLGLLSCLFFAVGLVLDMINHRAREAYRLRVQQHLRSFSKDKTI